MCKQAGIRNGCGAVGNTTATACCCDEDLCIDPLRTPLKGLTCFTGIYVAEDNYLTGGEMICDGWCASLSTTVNSKNATTYWCAPVRTCQNLGLGMGGDNDCAIIAGTGNTLSGCCCSENDNCNIPSFLLPNVTVIKPRKEPPIVCYEALWINGVNTGTDSYRICNGECVSLVMGDMLPNQTVVTSTLYTCETSGSCASMNIRNNCSTIDGTVTTCCCDTDACIDPTVNRMPGNTLSCYVGVSSPFNGGIYAGVAVQCDGKCANFTTTVNNMPFTSFHCMPTKTCRDMAGLDNSCGSLILDRTIIGCCCDSSNGCNAQGPLPSVIPPEAPIACYNGFSINGILQGDWAVCHGDCILFGLNTTYNGASFLGTIYACDPTVICQQLNVQDECNHLEPGVQACCCSDSGCIDPTLYPPKKPRIGPFTCWVGVQFNFNNLNAGAEDVCDGSCATISSTVAGNNITIFACVPSKTCKNLGIYDDCAFVSADRALTTCCCDDVDNCNAIGYNVPANTTAPNYHDYPIVCYQGMRINNSDIVKPTWTACSGDCVSISMATTVGQNAYTADFFTCDPSTICRQLKLVNNCSAMEPGISGCCCDTDACIDPTIYPQRKPGQLLKCYVGLKTSAGISVGAEIYCNEKCGYMQGNVGGQNVSAYVCAPSNICRSLELNNKPKTLPNDRAITAFCCNNVDNCNVFDKSINTSTPVSGIIEYPITCYSGIFVDGLPVTPGSFQSCNGDCALVTMNTTYQGITHSAQLYTCDPTRVCKGLGVFNMCSTIEVGLDGCCCNSNGCLDPTKNPPKKPENPLSCYVGVYSPAADINAGAEMYCNGKCASLSGIINGNPVTTYHCVDSSTCLSLELDDKCMPFVGDKEITVCCCDNYSNCNVNRNVTPAVIPPTPSPRVEYPITCWNGIYINGVSVTAEKWAICSGDCASISLATQLGGQNHTAKLYGCNPSSVCTQLNTQNQCQTLEAGVSACCCNTDACLDPLKGKDPSNPLLCYVGVHSTYKNISVGASVLCSGKCASLGGIVGGYQVITYQCIPTPICKSLELYDTCNGLPGDFTLTACCCDNSRFCNIANTTITPPPVNPLSEEPITCFSGIYLNGNAITPTTYTACAGECVSMSFNTSFNGQNQSATLYTCYPSQVCAALGLITPGCSILEPGVSTCCCSTDACITPNKIPGQRLSCYVGVYSAATNFSAGADADCTGGQCASLQTTVNGKLIKSYHCVQSQVCQTLGVYNGCGTVTTDRDIKACCCDSGNNCNVGNEIVVQNISQSNWTGPTIGCLSATYVNGQVIGTENWLGCKGDCASMTYNTRFNGGNNTLSIYSCDPVAACKSMGLFNGCNPNIAGSETGVTACCCDSDGCLTERTKPGTSLTCYVGIYSDANNYSTGVDVDCTRGMCVSLSTLTNNKLVKSYHCVQPSTCTALGVYRTCGTLTTDHDITACCCDSENNCNVGNEIVAHNIPQTNWTGPAIGCLSATYINGQLIGNENWIECKGDCSSMTFNTQLKGMNNTLSMYTCDPVAACQSMGLHNGCNPSIAGSGTGVTACCCDSDGCVTEQQKLKKPLICYVGVYSAATNFSAGADTDCTGGQCVSLQTTAIEQMIKFYHCVPTQVCTYLGITNSCGTLTTDRDITACCCDTGNNCNVGTEVVVHHIPQTNWTGAPISCLSALYVNGQVLGTESYVVCAGDCASMTYNTQFNGMNNTLSMYTCDPVAACQAMGLNNGCNTNIAGSGAGVTACCCDSDGCVTEQQKPGKKLICYVGIYSAATNFSAGVDADCTGGQCVSFQTTANEQMVKSYHCVQTQICDSLGMTNSCGTLTTDRDIEACCCDTSNNCNVGKEVVVQKIPQSNWTGAPIGCLSATYLNGQVLGTEDWVACYGDCASMTYKTQLNGVNNTLSMFSCDPVAACQSMGLKNSCNLNIAGSGAGVTACCCDSAGCLTEQYQLPTALTCYVGIYSGANNFSAGADVDCTGGMCASMSTYSNKQLVKSYHCIQADACSAMGIYRTCGTLTTDRDITACCCDSENNCNVGNEILAQQIPQSNWKGLPIGCWTGTYMNEQPFGTPAIVECPGDCSAVQYSINLNKQNNTLTVFQCDPMAVCKNLGLNNTCNPEIAGIGVGLTACCCDSDGCIKPGSIYPKNTNNNDSNDNNGSKDATSVSYSFAALFSAVVYIFLSRRN